MSVYVLLVHSILFLSTLLLCGQITICLPIYQLTNIGVVFILTLLCKNVIDILIQIYASLWNMNICILSLCVILYDQTG